MLKEVFLVPPDKLIQRLADELKKYPEITPPKESIFWKTAPGKRFPPEQEDWWYIRCASLLRKIAIHGPIGVSRLRGFYGYKKKFGHRRPHHVKGSGKIIRIMLQQLEKAGLLRKEVVGPKNVIKGRVLSYNGGKLLLRLINSLRAGGES